MTVLRRVATPQSSLRDEWRYFGHRRPWVETHGYHHDVAMRLESRDRLCGVSKLCTDLFLF